jgi:hypothetical protein
VLLTQYFVTNTNDTGVGSLRQAILNANADTSPDLITFNISNSGSLQTITVNSPLPQVTNAVTIDATTEVGYKNKPLVELDGHKAGSGDGLDIAGGNSVIKGLLIDRFSGYGLALLTNGGDLVVSNFLGTNAAGTGAQPNGAGGLQVQSANNTIGGITKALANLISGNTGVGVQVTGSTTSGNLVLGNLIGTDFTGVQPLGNGTDGVLINGGADLNTIGGLGSGGNNLISGNTQSGVHVAGSGTSANLIQNNLIGTEKTGTGPIANGTYAVLINQGAINNSVGGIASGQGNLIAFNPFGVAVQDNSTVGTTIRGNSIFNSGVLGIDLGNSGVQTNHLGSTTGPNNLQNYPVLTSVDQIGKTTKISGSLSATPNTTYVLDFYKSPSPGLTYYGEGKTYLGSVKATTDGNGYVLFTTTLQASSASGDWITGTATSPNGSTSEFSGARQITSTPFNLSETSWQSIGPSPVAMSPETFPMISGRIEAVAADPSNSNIMYVAGRGGVWKTTDWSDPSPIWVPLTDTQNSTFVNNRSYSGLEVYNSSTIFVAVSGPGGGVLKSTNSGSTWTELGNAVFDQAELGAIVVDPNNVNSIYVAAWVGASNGGGVYHSADGGQSWTNLTAGIHNGGVSSLVMDPSNSQTLYAGLVPYINHGAISSSGLYKSTDGGNSWTRLKPGNLTGTKVGAIIRVVVAPSSTQTLYATILDPALGNSPDGLQHRFVSTDGGSTWTALNALPTAEDGDYFSVALAVDPSNSQVIYVDGQGTFYRSADGGQTWTLLANYDTPAGVYFDDNGSYIMAGFFGLYGQAAPSLSMLGKQGNLTNLEFQTLTLDPNDETLAYGIAHNQFAALKYTDYPVWTVLGQPATSTSGFGAFGKILVDPTKPARLYEYAPDNPSSLVERSDDGGITWTDKSNGLPNIFASVSLGWESAKTFTMDPSNHDRLLVGVFQVYQSTDDANTWSAISPVLSTGAEITAVSIAPSDPNTIYAATNDGKVFWTQNSGSTWQEIDSGLPVDSFDQIVDIEIDPANPKHAFIVPGPVHPTDIDGPTHVWTTASPAQGWTDITGNLNTENWTDTLVVDWRYSTPVLYVGTERGVYQSTDTGAHWNLFGQSLPNVPVTDLQFLPARGMLAAATYGRGVWEIATDDLPTLALDAGLNLNEGASATITSNMLHVTDDTPSDPATEMVYTLVTVPAYGTLAKNGKALGVGNIFTQDDINNGRITYQHDGSDNLNDSFNFTVTDGNALASIASGFYIVINDMATLVNNTGFGVPEGGTTVITSNMLLATDDDASDAASDLVYTITVAPAHGTLSLSNVGLGVGGSFTQDDINNGRVAYTQDGSDNSDNFRLSLVDGDSLGSLPVQVVVTFWDLPDLTINPLIAGEGVTTTITSATLLATDDTPTDPTSELVFQLTSLPSHGTIAVNGTTLGIGGTFTQADIDNDLVTYTHDGTETTSDSFNFTVTDGLSPASLSAALNIVVGDLADQTVNTGASVPEGGTITITSAMLLATDDDPDPPTDLVYVVTAPPSHGGLYVNGGLLVVGNFFTQDDINNGRVTYTQDGSDNNDAFSFNLVDGASPASRPGTFVITFEDLPTLVVSAMLVGDGTTTTITPQQLQVTDDDAFDPHTELVFTPTTVPAHGTLLLGSSVLHVGNSFTQDDIDKGRLQYVQDGSETNSDSFSFGVVDGSSTAALPGTMNITIGDIPTLTNNTGMALPEGTSSALTSTMLLYTDDQPDPPTDLVYTVTGATAFGQLQLSGKTLHVADTFTQDDINQGRLIYIHGGSDNNDSFTFKVVDGNSPLALTGTFNITFEDLPTLVVSSLTLAEGSSATVTTQQLLATDDTATDPPTELVYTVTVAPAHGTLLLNGTALSVGNTFTQDDVQKGRLTYAQDGNDAAGDSVGFTLVDGTSAASVSGTLNIIIGDLPTPVTNTGMALPEGQSGTITSAMLLYSDDTATDPATDLIYTVSTVPAHGTLTVSGKRLVAGNTFTQDDINNGRVVYTQDGSDSNDKFTFTVTDGSSPSSLSDTFLITFQDLPTLSTHLLIVAQGGSGTLTPAQLLATDDTATDPPTELVYTLTSVPAHGTLTLSGTTLGVGSTFTQDDVSHNRLVYAHDGSATTSDGFAFTLVDGSSPASLAASYSITVAAPADHLVLQAPTYVLAGGSWAVTVDAVAANGITDPLYVGSVALALSNGPTGGALAGVTVAPVQNGVATFRNLSLNQVGNYTLYAASTSDLLGAAANITVGAPVHFKILGTPSLFAAGQPFTVSVTALDPQGHQAAGYLGTVHFTSTDPHADLPPDYTFTIQDAGLKSFPITLDTAGKMTFSIADVTRAATLTTSSPVTITPGVAVGFTVTGFPSPATSGAQAAFTVTARDAYGNRAVSYSGLVHFTSSDPNAKLPADTPFTGTDQGAHNFLATLTTLGDQSITATDAAHSLISGTESGIAVDSPAIRLSITGVPTTGTTAGQPFTISVTAQDGAGHTDAAFTDTIHFASSDPHAVLPADYTFLLADGGKQSFPITLETAGSQTITVTDTVRPAIKGLTQGINVGAAAVNSLGVAGYPSPSVSGTTHSFTVTALDAYGNRVSSYRGQIKFSTTGQVTPPGPYTFSPTDKGAHTFLATFKNVGSMSLTATDTVTSSITGTQTGIQVVSPATRLAVIGMPPSATAGQTLAIQVTALVAPGKPDTLFPDTIHFTSTDRQATLPPDYTFLPGDQGSKTFNIILGTVGSQTVTVTDVSRPTIKGTSTPAKIGPGTVRSLSVTGFPSPALPGTQHSFTVTALDAYGNRAVSDIGQQVQLSSSDPQAQFVPPNPYTFTAADKGAHTFLAILNTVGTQSLIATDPVNHLTGTQSGIDVAQLTGALNGPTIGVTGQPLAFTLTATEGGQPASTVFSYRIDWDGNGKVDQIVSGASGLTVLHAFPGTGKFTPRMTIVDTAGNASPLTLGQQVTVQTVAPEPDPANPSLNALAVGGTTGNNVIVITPADPTGTTVDVTINKVLQQGGPFAPTGHILVYGQNGNDTLQIASKLINGQTVSVAIPALLYGGGGTNVISVVGSSADNVLVGGSGKDSLTGGSGRDILIGGLGADRLQAGTGEDILIGSTTSFDLNPTALFALASEWDRTDLGYQGRVQDLFGRTSGGLNGAYQLNPKTVTHDTAVNQLFGSTAFDWDWLTHEGKVVDKVSNYLGGEAATFE